MSATRPARLVPVNRQVGDRVKRGHEFACPWCRRLLHVWPGVYYSVDPTNVAFGTGWVVDGERIVWRKPHHRGVRVRLRHPVTGERIEADRDRGQVIRWLPTDLPIVCHECAGVAT